MLGNELISKQIANYLAQKIIKGELNTESRLAESRLAKEYQVSRGSVREALLILESWHLVTIYPNRGAVVRGLNLDKQKDFLELWFTLLNQAIIDIKQHMLPDTEHSLNQHIKLLEQLQTNSTVDQYYEQCQNILTELYAMISNSCLHDMLNLLLPVSYQHLYGVLTRTQNSKANIFKCLSNIYQTLSLKETISITANQTLLFI
ncbi:GntR family transcriptional regulator [Neisseria sp. Ec49-e6-T10]|uniref:GntR family transcriptional regulator n=1 Tax=Neisseria sp. Ec49-e6-T10 TaxID=3140744 RepID=UPI003EC0EE6C